MANERHPKTIAGAWEHLFDVLQNESVCYTAGGQPGADFRPLRHDGVNCGQAVYNAVEQLQETGTLTRDQILAIAQLCAWVARAARG